MDEPRFIDGTPVPADYLPAVERMIEVVCDIEDECPSWWLEA